MMLYVIRFASTEEVAVHLVATLYAPKLEFHIYAALLLLRQIAAVKYIQS